MTSLGPPKPVLIYVFFITCLASFLSCTPSAANHTTIQPLNFRLFLADDLGMKTIAAHRDNPYQISELSTMSAEEVPSVATNKKFQQTRSTLTQELYHKLLDVKGSGFYFGMQDATGYGVGWRDNNDSSDVKKVTGDYPALAGWGASYSPCEIADGENFDDARYKIKLFHDMGGFNTVEWHAQNPYGGDFYWKNHPDKSKNVVAAILPGGEKHHFLLEKLDNLASFFNSLLDDDGEKIPVIFRPWHEHTKNWFWWGQSRCSRDEYIKLWQFTVEYLTIEKGITNLLYAYSPWRVENREHYLERYPGDEYVDILGYDNYWDLSNLGFLSSLYQKRFINYLKLLVNIANEKGKPAALTETGPWTFYAKADMPENDWYTQKLLKAIMHDETTRQISYVMTWRNDRSDHFHVPYPGHPGVADFRDFYRHPYTIFMSDIK